VTFKPEFLNRVDEIIIFNRLDKGQILSIVDIQLKALEARLREQKIGILFDAKAKALLADRGFDPAFGARPLKRTIQSLVQNPLAKLMLKGEVLEGDVISVTATKDGLSFAKAKTKAA